MQRRFAPGPRRAKASLGLVLVALWAWGCATSPKSAIEERRPELAARIAELGLDDDPAVQAARERLEAAVAAEPSDVVVDGLELRAVVTRDVYDEIGALVRLPFANPLEVTAKREARRAETDQAFAELEEVALEQRVALCAPSVKHLVLEEQKRIFESYAVRHRALLDWNEELGRAGLLDEVRVSRFELDSRVRLTTRDPSSRTSPLALIGFDQVLDVLPEPAAEARLLPADRELLRERLLRHQPSVGVHRASRKQLEALARSESAKRYPSLNFFDIGFDPVVAPGKSRTWGARVSVDVPFGRAASANQDRYEALARAEQSSERLMIERRIEDAWFAIEEINAFRRDGARWRDLTALADSAEEIADRWWEHRQADPSQIATLLDTVYSARLAVLDARERAGLADCDMMAATGLSISESDR